MSAATPWRRVGSAVAAAAFAALTILIAPAPPGIAASPTTATLVIQKGGDRTGGQTVGGLGGVVFDFFAGVSGTPPAANAVPDASCTTTAPSGTCEVDVPGRVGGTDTGVLGYWIREKTAPAPYSIITTLDTGPGSATVPTPYNQLFTGNVANNITYSFPVAQTGNDNFTARGSTWADVRANPPLPNRCGLRIALLIDTSGSVAPFLTQIKDAAKGFVDALGGTPSQVALYQFANSSTQLVNATSVATQSGQDTVDAAIDLLTAGGSTNWDIGLARVAASPIVYDAVLMLTDGNPTVYGPNAEGPAVNTRFREVENGVFSANALKAKGTRVAAVGVGAGVSGAADNLAAISGPVAGSDYIQTGYPELAALFRSVALNSCVGTVTVVKQVIPPGGTVADAVPAGGWTFTSTSGNTTPASAVTAAVSGAANFDVNLGGATSAPVTLDETLQAGFTPFPVAGQNATCTANGAPITSTNVGATGFTVTASAVDVVSCIVYNQAPLPVATLRVNKTWVVNGTTFANGQQQGALQAALTITGQTSPAFGTVIGGYHEGDSVTIGENISLGLLPPGCGTVVPSGDVGAHVLTAGANVFAITNTVTCTSTVTLFKRVVNEFGPAEPVDSWTLRAFGPGGTELFSGVNGVTHDVTPGTRYLLAESTVAGYGEEIAPNALIVPPATGSWHCALRQRDGTLGPEYDGLNGGVTVQLGQHAECFSNNVALPGRLTLRKTVTNGFGGTATPADWTLSATPTTPGNLLSGHTGDAAITRATITPGVGYTLAETGPTGYTSSGPSCVITGTTTAVPVFLGVITATIGEDITCTFANVQAAPPPTTPPPTGPPVTASPSGNGPPGSPGTPLLPVTGRQVGLVAGVGVVLIIAGMMVLVVRRRNAD